MILVDQQRITRAFYNTLTPYEQGYASYFQAYWPRSELPKVCPHPAGSDEASKWHAGSRAAYIAVLDTEGD